jgi:hypothetical protein
VYQDCISSHVMRLEGLSITGIMAAPWLPLACFLAIPSACHLLPQKEGLKVAHKQGEHELLVRVPIGEGVRGKDIAFEVHPTRLRLAANNEVLLEGDFSGHKVELAGVCWFIWASATCIWHCCCCRTAPNAGSPECQGHGMPPF